jgi:hypothetical protein
MQESPAGPKRIKIPPNNQSEFYPKEQKLPFSTNPFLISPAMSPPPLPSPPCTAHHEQQLDHSSGGNSRSKTMQCNGGSTLPLPRTSQSAKELLQLRN